MKTPPHHEQLVLPGDWGVAVSLVDRFESRLRELHLIGLTLWTVALRTVIDRLRALWSDTRGDIGRARYLADSARAALNAALEDGVVSPAERAMLERTLERLDAKLVEAETQLREGRVIA